MSRTLLSLLLFISSIALHAVSYKSAETDAYIQKYHKVAIRHMKQFRIPASITLAQGILESGSGRSDLAVKANNHFGIKCKTGDDGPCYRKRDDKRRDYFRKYATPEESFEDHAHFLADRAIYASLFQYKTTEYKKWAKGLKKCGYATNSKYPTILCDIIEQNNLYVYDQNPDKYLKPDDQPAKRDDDKKQDEKKQPVVVGGNNPPRMINGKLAGVKCTVVGKGGTFYSISKAAGISVSKLYDYNDVDATHILQPGQILFLKAKNSSYSAAPYHFVEPGETPWSISQKYAVALKSLLKMNKLSAMSSLKVGQKIKLKK